MALPFTNFIVVKGQQQQMEGGNKKYFCAKKSEISGLLFFFHLFALSIPENFWTFFFVVVDLFALWIFLLICLICHFCLESKQITKIFVYELPR